MNQTRHARRSAPPYAPALAFVASMAAAAIAQTPPPDKPAVPEWAYPGSATRTQVAPPADFRRASTHYAIPIGAFEGQSDVGTAVVPGRATFDAATARYTVASAGYNIWYTRDEFRFLWKKLSGDVSIAADVTFPDPGGYGDRKAVLVVREDLDDDAKEVVAALHGLGMIQLAQRPQKGALVNDLEFRVGGRGSRPGGSTPDSLVNVMAGRIGLEKRGDAFALFASFEGEPMHQLGPPITLKIDGPFYAGVGFCSHLPDVVDTALLSNVLLENAAGKVR